MKLKNVFNYTFLLLAALFVQSCHDSDTASGSVLNVTFNDEAIESLQFQMPASSAIIGIETDANWTASTDAEWCTINNHAGYGSTARISYLRVDVETNGSDARSAKLMINAGGMSKVITVNQAGVDLTPGDPFESAYAFVENVKLGYNLGNTLDANHDITDPEVKSWFNPTTVYDWETCWGQPVTTPAIINAIAARGFNAVRVPVTWFPHMDADGNVEEAWMNRVEEVVKYVLDAGCYCILNVQHDTGAKDENRGDNAAWIAASIDEYPVTSVKFKKLWTQIATRFKDYDEKLLFEAVNEVLPAIRQWNHDPSASDMEALNKLEQDFVDAVRATGGNNQYRNLVCNPVGASNTDLVLNGYQVPVDVNPSHLLASVHSYEPWAFCNDAGEYNKLVFDKDGEAELDAIFARVDARFKSLGIPYFFGEFGAIDENKAMAERIKYAEYMAKKLKSYKTTGLWWMGLYDRAKDDWYEYEIVDALFKNIE